MPLTLVYTDATGATHIEHPTCHSSYLIRVEELESAGYRVIEG